MVFSYNINIFINEYKMNLKEITIFNIDNNSLYY